MRLNKSAPINFYGLVLIGLYIKMTKMKIISACKTICLLSAISFSLMAKANTSGQPAVFFNVKDYGATGNGTSLETKLINAAIDAAVAAGGGTVYFPAGNYLTGSVHLKSNITLYIEQGAVIIGASAVDSNEYDKPEKPINDQ